MIGAAIGAALVGGAIVAASVVSTGQAEGPVTVRQNAGTLELSLGVSSGTVVLKSTTGQVVATQNLTTNGKCLVASSGPELLAITSSSGKVGLVNNGLGVKTKNNCATAEGRIAAGQWLNVALGAYFASQPDVLVDFAELDVEGKFNAALSVTYSDGTEQIALISDSDNGPDSNINSNTRVTIGASKDFSSIRLAAATGEAALDGGGDAAYATYLAAGKVGPLGQALGTDASVFQLVSVEDFEYSIDCLDNVAEIGGAAETGFVRNLNDGATSPADCEDIGVSIDIQEDTVLLTKTTAGLETGTEQNPNARVTINWEPQAKTDPVPDREINFTPSNPNSFEAVQWCVSFTPPLDDNGDPIQADDPDLDPADPGVAVHPADARFENGLLPWCLIHEEIRLLPNGQIQQIQIYDGKGDPMWR